MSTNVEALRRQGGSVAVVGVIAIAVFGLSQPRWLIGSLVVWAYCVWLLFRGLDDNRAEGATAVLSSFGLPIGVTLVRGALLAGVAGFLFLPEPIGLLAFVPAIAYTLASILDHVDGRVARAMDRTTRLGEKLDMELDACGILVASLLAVHYDKVPPWYLAIGVARYMFVLAIWWRRRRGELVVDLDPSSLRRWLAGIQMGFLSAALWPPLPAALSHFVAPLAGGASLAMFLRDYWHVSGRLPKRERHAKGA